MNEIKRIKKLIDRYGCPFKMTSSNLDDAIDVVAYVQPMRYKNKMFVDCQFTELGVVDESCFLFIGKPEVDPLENDSILFDSSGRAFAFVKIEKMYIADQKAYTWAIIRARS